MTKKDHCLFEHTTNDRERNFVYRAIEQTVEHNTQNKLKLFKHWVQSWILVCHFLKSHEREIISHHFLCFIACHQRIEKIMVVKRKSFTSSTIFSMQKRVPTLLTLFYNFFYCFYCIFNSSYKKRISHVMGGILKISTLFALLNFKVVLIKRWCALQFIVIFLLVNKLT